MGLPVTIFHLRPLPPLRFFASISPLGLGKTRSSWSKSGVLGWKPVRPRPELWRAIMQSRRLDNSRIGKWGCTAHLSEDAPFAVAIGACILNSLVFPIPAGPEDEEDGSGGGIDFTDARFAVMGILSFIPYFNWMSWIFAWLDTGKQRYLIYSIVYLAPYLRTNLSISPDDSWLPIASILACIIHIQLEANIRNGVVSGIPTLEETLKYLLRAKKDPDDPGKHEGNPKEEESIKKPGKIWGKFVDGKWHLDEKKKEEEGN